MGSMHALDHVQAQKPMGTTWVAVRSFSNLLTTKLHLVVVRRFEKLLTTPPWVLGWCSQELPGTHLFWDGL